LPREQVTVAGNATTWVRTAESGHAVTFHFCPTCGSTVYRKNDGFPGTVGVAIGNLANPSFPAPTIAVWEQSRHPWVSLPPDTPPKSVRRSRVVLLEGPITDITDFQRMAERGSRLLTRRTTHARSTLAA
jgi:hypothetical protein